MPKYALVPQVDGPAESPTFYGGTGENESDQDIMITGYDQSTKPMTKVLVLECPPLLATLPPHVAKDMMCKGTVHILCQSCTTETIFSKLKQIVWTGLV